jgi:hypothetical protein
MIYKSIDEGYAFKMYCKSNKGITTLTKDKEYVPLNHHMKIDPNGRYLPQMRIQIINDKNTKYTWDSVNFYFEYDCLDCQHWVIDIPTYGFYYIKASAKDAEVNRRYKGFWEGRGGTIRMAFKEEIKEKKALRGCYLHENCTRHLKHFSSNIVNPFKV